MTLFLDMDGVLADFDAGAEKQIGTDNTYKWEWINGSEAFWNKLNEDPEFFFNLPPLPDALLLFGAVRHLNPVVLTALPKKDATDVEDQKRRWMRKYFGAEVPVTTCMTSEKPYYCEPGDIIVDDRNVNAEAWRAAGGIYVLHKGARETILSLQLMKVLH